MDFRCGMSRWPSDRCSSYHTFVFITSRLILWFYFMITFLNYVVAQRWVCRYFFRGFIGLRFTLCWLSSSWDSDEYTTEITVRLHHWDTIFISRNARNSLSLTNLRFPFVSFVSCLFSDGSTASDLDTRDSSLTKLLKYYPGEKIQMVLAIPQFLCFQLMGLRKIKTYVPTYPASSACKVSATSSSWKSSLADCCLEETLPSNTRYWWPLKHF